jgi:large subunit ribosomal protein L29
MAKSEISSMDAAQLKEQLLELRKEQFNLRMQQGTGQLANPARFKVVRKDIARIKTRMSEIGRTKT